MGYISIQSGNHDLPRISKGRTFDELKVAYAFLLTMPGIPFIYYGDEIGMKYIENIPSKEGGYNRTGSRTPMQWDNTKNKEFSTSDETYLPLDNSKGAPTVKEQLEDKNSLLNAVKDLIKVRSANEALWADSGFEVIQKGYPFVYKRYNENTCIIVAVNPSDKEIELEMPVMCDVLMEENVQYKDSKIKFNKQSYIIYVTNENADCTKNMI